MRVSLEWLTEYVEIDLDALALADKLTMAGIEVENVEPYCRGLQGVVTGRVLETSPVQGTSLSLARVDTGEGCLGIICGAPNLQAGQVVPVALPGAQLPAGQKIGVREIAGHRSQGMILSAAELGLDLAGDGILVLDPELPPGADLRALLRLDDWILHLSLTPNRADCLGLWGLAQEVAALTGGRLHEPVTTVDECNEQASGAVSIDVLSPQLCPRYTARVVRGVTIAPSPFWLQRRLSAAGVRPINNIVDITNYIMLEQGQPMHAFDLDLLENAQIIVRQAGGDRQLVTLDNQERQLNEGMLVIADGKKAIGLAGIMGGLNTEITGRTRNIVFEAAVFDAGNIRRSSKELNLSTEASYRFERGIDPGAPVRAQDRAARLLNELGVGRVLAGLIDIYPRPFPRVQVTVRRDQVSRILGVDLSGDALEEIFTRLAFPWRKADRAWTIDVPARRRDITQEIDMIEEVARLYGYDRIPLTLPHGVLTEGREQPEGRINALAREHLIACGYYEVITFSFMNPGWLDKLDLPSGDRRRRYASIRNPLSVEQEAMRTTLIPHLLNVLQTNSSYQIDRQQLFEIGTVFQPRSLPLQELPQERQVLALAATGLAARESWLGERWPVDFFSVKGTLESFFRRMGINDTRFVPGAEPFLHPTRQASIYCGEHDLGAVGQLHPDVSARFGLKQPVYIAEVDFDLIVALANLLPAYQPPPRYPGVLRDIAVVVAKTVAAADVQECIRAAGGELVESVRLFDVYEGEQVPGNCRSLAYAITYRHKQRTLKDEEVNVVHERIVRALQAQLGGELRQTGLK